MLLDEIDKKATRSNVDKLLKYYHSFRRLSGIYFEQDSDSIIEQLPTITSSETEELNKPHLKRAKKAQHIFKAIHQTLQVLSSRSCERIEQRYILDDNISGICSDEMISNGTFYRQLNKGLMDFAELYSESDELLAFNKEADHYEL